MSAVMLEMSSTGAGVSGTRAAPVPCEKRFSDVAQKISIDGTARQDKGRLSAKSAA
jgi:hypothetical protein